MTDRPFAINRSHALARATMANLRRWSHSATPVLHVAQASNGPDALVIGGGPSIERLDECLHPGRLVLTANTPAPKVCDVVPGAVVCFREMIALPEQAERICRAKYPPRAAVVDIGTASATVEVLEAHSIPIVWVISAGHLAWLSHLLDVRPLMAGESAMTGCVAVAHAIGCRSITLLGTDLAFGDDGAAYGAGTVYDGVRGEMHGGFVDMGDRGGMGAEATRSGCAPAPLREQASPVLLEDGRQGWALATWESQRKWLEQAARRHPRTLHHNLSGRARIEGWATGDVAGRRLAPPSIATQPLPVERIDAEVRRQLMAARTFLDSPTHHAAARLDGCPLVELYASKAIAEAATMQLPLHVSLVEHRRATEAALAEAERDW